MNAAFNTDGNTTTQRALSSKSCGMSSGTFRISSITVPAFWRRLVSSFAFSSAPRANAIGAIKSAPIRTAFQRFICRFSFLTFRKSLANAGLKKAGLYAPIQMTEKRRQKKNHENKEENLRDSRRCRRDSGKSENCGDQGDDKKSQGPPQHFASSGKSLFSFEGVIGRCR